MGDLVKLRAWWAHRQGLGGSWNKLSAAQILERAGWARSVGGDGPYCTLFARAGLSREKVDAEVAKAAIHELPSARGCTYVLPASDFALGLRVGEGFNSADLRNAEKLGVPRKEIDKLCESVVSALEKGPLDPEGIRDATGKHVRNLGEEGKKKGLTTTLPIALGILQLSGEIRRIPMNGRIDQQRYRYSVWRPNPLAKFKPSKEEAYTELARRFFQWIGPARVTDFQGFAALGVKVSKTAVEPLKLEPLEPGSDRMMLPEDRAAFASYRPPKDPQYALVSGLDSLLLLRSSLEDLIDPKDVDRLSVGPKKPAGSSLAFLDTHGIVDRGRIVGIWEFDTAANAIVWVPFVKKEKALQEAVARMESFVRDQLGDARSFSLDSPKSRAPKLEAMRKAAK